MFVNFNTRLVTLVTKRISRLHRNVTLPMYIEVTKLMSKLPRNFEVSNVCWSYQGMSRLPRKVEVSLRYPISSYSPAIPTDPITHLIQASRDVQDGGLYSVMQSDRNILVMSAWIALICHTGRWKLFMILKASMLKFLRCIMNNNVFMINPWALM